MTGKTARLGREAMSEQIVSAACEVLASQGFSDFGINAVARAAGCDKQLIYRYFGGLEGLVAAIGAQLGDRFAKGLSAPEPTPQSYADLIETLLLSLFDLIRADPLLRNITAWELADPSPLVAPLVAARSTAIQRWLGEVRGALAPPPSVDVAAVNAVLIGGVQQLALAGARSEGFAGLRLDEAGNTRVKAAIALLCRVVR